MNTTDKKVSVVKAATTGSPSIDVNSATCLVSWKDIASYFRRSVRTVQRWERVEGMPVHRHAHEKGDSLFAYTHELDEWRNSRSHAGPKQSAEALAELHIHNLPPGQQSGLRGLIEAIREQIGMLPTSAGFVIVFHGTTLIHRANKGIDCTDVRIAGDINGNRAEPHPFLPEVQ